MPDVTTKGAAMAMLDKSLPDTSRMALGNVKSGFRKDALLTTN